MSCKEIEKISKKIFVMIDKDGGGGGGNTAVMRGDKELMGVPPLEKTLHTWSDHGVDHLLGVITHVIMQ